MHTASIQSQELVLPLHIRTFILTEPNNGGRPQTTFDALQPCWLSEMTMVVLVGRFYRRPVNPSAGDNGREDSSGRLNLLLTGVEILLQPVMDLTF